jgi:cytochrome c553
MKVFALSFALAASLAQVASDRPPTRNVGTMSDLMVKIIYPSSDALFYIESRTPKTDSEWTALEGQALMVAESANLLMMPGRARDQKQWMADAKLMLDAGAAAVTAAKAKDVAAISALSEQLMESCTSCHRHYRKGYGQPKPPPLD